VDTKHVFGEQDPLEFYGYLMPKLEALKMDSAFLNRNVNEGFSGGEKKRNEVRSPTQQCRYSHNAGWQLAEGLVLQHP
jgi:Fe-S cluster assembly ATPase SufC